MRQLWHTGLREDAWPPRWIHRAHRSRSPANRSLRSGRSSPERRLLAWCAGGNDTPVLVDVSRLPAHVAIIMDGNGRWAEQLGRPRPEGHRAGSDAVRRIVRASRRLGLRALTLYAFSEQNWERPESEVDALMGLLSEFLVSERNEILENRIRLRAVGRVDRLPRFVRDVLDPLSKESEDHDSMVLTLALSYGGREEIALTARELARKVREGVIEPDAIDVAMFDSVLPSMESGPVDLLIRTGGEQRISNFLLWGGAYAELYFSDALWPDYTERDLHEAIATYQQRDRRFGRVSSSAHETCGSNGSRVTDART